MLFTAFWLLQANKLDTSKINALLDTIPKRGQRAYEALITALQGTENTDAADRLTEAAKGAEKVVTTSKYSGMYVTTQVQSKGELLSVLAIDKRQ